MQNKSSILNIALDNGSICIIFLQPLQKTFHFLEFQYYPEKHQPLFGHSLFYVGKK